MQPTVTVIQSPKLPEYSTADPSSIALAEKWRAFRLHSLKTAPDAFASSYDVERKQGLELTWGRLDNERAVSFAAVDLAGKDTSELTATESLISPDISWLGNIALLGPLRPETAARIIEINSPGAESVALSLVGELLHEDIATSLETAVSSEVLHFFIAATFVDVSARRRGVGLALMEGVLAEAESQGRAAGVVSVSIIIMVDARNESARKLYEKAGFAVAGEGRYFEHARETEGGEAPQGTRRALMMDLKRTVAAVH